MIGKMVGGDVMVLLEVVTVLVPAMEWRIPVVVVVLEGCVMMVVGRRVDDDSYPYCHALALSIPGLL